MKQDNRDHTIDIVRGIAIVTMVGANLAMMLPEPHSSFLRYYSTFAAPIFVTLAGTMMAFAVSKSTSHQVSYFVKRGVFLLVMGAAVDVVAWNFIPFIGFDVLYLIGLALPFLFLSARLGKFVVLALAMTVFVLTPIVQKYFGYIEVPLTPLISELFSPDLRWETVAKHWLIDGWFPILPWAGFGLFGVFIGQVRWQPGQPIRRFSSFGLALASCALLVLGLLGMHFFPGPLYTRLGYSELFYPATLGFISLSLGVVTCLFCLVDAMRGYSFWEIFRPFGEASLFMYIVHSLVIGLMIENLWPHMTTGRYLLVYAALVLFLALCGKLLRSFRKKYRDMPVILKWVVGG